MKTPQYRDIVAATKLTRAGNLTEATALLQASLTVAGAPVAAQATVVQGALIGVTRGQFLTKTFNNSFGARSYKLYVPNRYDGQPRPLIVMLHGCTQSAGDFATGTRMNELAEEFNFLVAYPEQPASANPRKCWNWFLRTQQTRDFGEPSIVAGITRQVMSGYAIDSQRVYVAGLSAGAAAAAVLGTTYPDIYAAVGVHSGIAYDLAKDVDSAFAVMKRGPSAAKSPSQPAKGVPTPTIVFHGDRDRTVNNVNSDRFAQALHSPEYAKRVEAGHVPGSRAYTKTTYADANGRDLLEQWDIHGAGHAWSGGSPAGSYTDAAGPDASREMVRFFLSHRLL
ncbi:MAG TPA: PHB depolymerase family esterase [Candidatus Tumulicola sp.]